MTGDAKPDDMPENKRVKVNVKKVKEEIKGGLQSTMDQLFKPMPK
jgi:hypothetical protein